MLGIRAILPPLAGALALGALTLCSCRPPVDDAPPQQPEEGSGMAATVVFDNYPGATGLRTGWGFSCHVALPETTVLFDTGADGGVLVSNMLALDLDPRGST